MTSLIDYNTGVICVFNNELEHECNDEIVHI